MDEIFSQSWLTLGFECEIRNPGDYIALTIGRSPVVVIRGDDGEVRGFFNSCRHRGAQICADGHDNTGALVAPYHQWAYDLKGELQYAGRMPETFRHEDHALRPIHVQLLQGIIYICLGETPPDFAAFRASAGPMLAPLDLKRTKLAYTSTLVEKANWKLVMENGRECYHCDVCHPELGFSFPTGVTDKFGAEEEERNTAFQAMCDAAGFPVGPADGPWWQTARFPLNEGALTMSLDGQFLVKKLIVPANGGDVGSCRIATEPHNFIHITGDHIFMFSAIPVGPEETHVVGKWFVHEDAVEGVDYALDSLTETWTKTNMQDRDLAENNQRGVNSMGYTPGPYAPDAEALVIRFVDWYCNRVRTHFGEPKLRVAVA